VVEVLLWPAIAAIRLIGTPWSISRVIVVCRRS
jgi:hypothetical protein